MTTHESLNVIVIGSGVVGLSSAFYLLSLSPSSRVTLLENSPSKTIAGGASSYAGGFIACGESWHNESSQDLARLSWECHLELARILDGATKYGYRECGAIGLNVGRPVKRSAYRTLPAGKGKEAVESERGHLPRGEWVEGDKEELSIEGGVAQVDPADFCQTLFRYLSSTYSDRFDVRFGESKSISRSSFDTPQSTLSFLPLDDTSDLVELPYDKLVIAAGPWSAQVCNTLGLPPIPITNLPGHSLIIRPALDAYTPVSNDNEKELPAGAVFAGIDGGQGGVHGESFGLARGLNEDEVRRGYTRAPEFFVRKNGLVYVAGENSIPHNAKASEAGLPNKLPPTVDGVKEMIDEECVGRLKRAAGAVSPYLKEENGAKIERRQFCYRPISSDREPIVGLLEPQVVVASGHGPWGITLSTGTGRVVAEMALGLELSADIAGLSPSRFGIEMQ